MEGVLIGLAAIVLVVTGPAALVIALVMRRRIKELHRQNTTLAARLAAIDGGAATPSVAGERSAPVMGEHPAPTEHDGTLPVRPPGVASTRPVAARPHRTSPTAAPRPGLDLESVIGGRWLTWIGILAIFFGTAFFLAYDLGDHALAGVGQLLVGILVGIVFIGSGVALSRRQERILGQGLLGGGIALLYLAAYAAYGFHALVSAAVVFPFLLGIAVIGATISLRLDSLAIAALTLIGALLTPLVLRPDGDPRSALFPYLIAVNVGAAVVATRRPWSFVPLAAFAGTCWLVLDWWSRHYDPSVRAGTAATVGALWLIYLIVPFLRPPLDRFWGLARGIVIGFNALVFGTFLYVVLAPDFTELRGLAMALLALTYVVGSRLASARMAAPAVTVTYYSGIALAVIAVPVQFDAGWTTLGWGLFGFVLIASGVQLPSFSHRLAGLIVMGFSLLRVLSFDTAEAMARNPSLSPVLNTGFLISVVVIAAASVTAWLFHRHPAVSPAERRLATPMVMVVASILLWRLSAESLGNFRAREIAAAAPGSMRLASMLTLSLVWAVYAAALIAIGFLARYRAIRLLGVIILGVLVVKVFLLDMQQLERGYRIASFVGVGILLLAISVLYQRERRHET